MAQKANTRGRQPPLFCAKCSTWAQDNPFSFISHSNDLLHVSFGLPCLRLLQLAIWLEEVHSLHVSALMGLAAILHKSSCLSRFIPKAIVVFFSSVGFCSGNTFYVMELPTPCTTLLLSHPGLGTAMVELITPPPFCKFQKDFGFWNLFLLRISTQ